MVCIHWLYGWLYIAACVAAWCMAGAWLIRWLVYRSFIRSLISSCMAAWLAGWLRWWLASLSLAGWLAGWLIHSHRPTGPNGRDRCSSSLLPLLAAILLRTVLCTTASHDSWDPTLPAGWHDGGYIIVAKK